MKIISAKSSVSMILFTGTLAFAEGPLADRGGWALGVPLPSGSEKNISLLKVLSPVTALALEIGLSSFYDETTVEDLDDPDLDYRSRYGILRAQIRPGIRHYRSLHGQVAPFVFFKAHAGISFWNRRSIWDRGFSVNKHTRTDGDLDLGLSVGLGTEWFPFQRISLSGQTGLELGYRPEESFGDRISEWSLETFETEMTALVYF